MKVNLKLTEEVSYKFVFLAENMRREGFEFCIGRPRSYYKIEDGVKMEPFEHLVIDLPDEHLQVLLLKNLEKEKLI